MDASAHPDSGPHSADPDCVAAVTRRALAATVRSPARPGTAGAGRARRLPERMDLRAWLPEVVGHARTLPVCTGVVTAGFAGYLERRLHARSRTASILFNYRTSRRYGGRPDRAGSTMDHALHAWQQYGLAPDESWPFARERIDADPPPSCFERATAWRAPGFHRLDCGQPGCPAYLPALRTALAAGWPASVEIPLHPSILRSFETGDIAPPEPDEPLVARHVVLLCGYDDTAGVSGTDTPGALLFQNSWGIAWGEQGYGRLPYSMVPAGLVRDSWIVGGPRPQDPLPTMDDQVRAETDHDHDHVPGD